MNDLKHVWHRRDTVGRHVVSHNIRFNVHPINRDGVTVLSLSVSVYVTYPSYDGERQTLHHSAKVTSYQGFARAVNEAVEKRDTWLQFVEAERLRIADAKMQPVRAMMNACLTASITDVERVRLKYGKVNVMWTNKLPFQIL